MRLMWQDRDQAGGVLTPRSKARNERRANWPCDKRSTRSVSTQRVAVAEHLTKRMKAESSAGMNALTAAELERALKAMKHLTLCLVCIAILPIAGCSRSNTSTSARIETGRGTFVSTNGEAITAVYYKAGDAGDHLTVTLSFPDKRQIELYGAPSGSGTRYTNNTAQWSEHQSEATYEVTGANVFRGKKAQ